MKLDELVRRRVFLAHARNSNSFVRSILTWSDFPQMHDRWRVVRDTTSEIRVERNEAIFIDGDWQGRLVVERSTVVHVRGDLAGAIELAAHAELIVAGHVLAGAKIVAQGFADVYVAGDFQGSLLSGRYRLLAIIDGSLGGEVRLACPDGRICVGGDWHGAIVRDEDAKSLNLEVVGFASDARIHELAYGGFLKLSAAIGESDVPSGCYSTSQVLEFQGRRVSGLAHWVVLQQRMR